ncbi:DUF58 domain-containing protein [Cytophagaceae bacterium ABcell3]|nr:DUF58 domain-containing protein [Cytophagaceae bacterium ABcell3]
MKLIKTLYFTKRLFILLGASAVVFVLSFFFPILNAPAAFLFLAVAAFLLLDVAMLFSGRRRIIASRSIPPRLSNGDENPTCVRLRNNYPYAVNITLTDELPIQLQERDFSRSSRLRSGKGKEVIYHIRPFERGLYQFGRINVFVKGLLGLAERRFIFSQEQEVPVYPSFLQMRRYEMLAFSSRVFDTGIRRLRRSGNTMEFEQIKEYVAGDDIRTINRNATARAAKLMVNQYQDERSRSVYCIIDKGRAMKMPFEKMTLLDYAINATLAISNIVLKKDDKAGLITFDHQIESMVTAERKGATLQKVMHNLYNLQTSFTEPDFPLLYTHISRKINQRSLMLLFTNFESLSSLRRQLPYLRKLALNHLLVVIFFENTELKALAEQKASDTGAIYVKTIAEKLNFEKKLIRKELEIFGIASVLTTPQELTLSTINKYMEVKARNML